MSCGFSQEVHNPPCRGRYGVSTLRLRHRRSPIPSGGAPSSRPKAATWYFKIHETSDLDLIPERNKDRSGMAIPLVADRVPHATSRTGACSAYLHRAIAVGLCLTPLLAFVVDRGMIYPMVTGRNFAFRAFVELLLAVYIPLALSTPRYRPRASALLIAFAAFVAWIGVATLLSDDLSRSFCTSSRFSSFSPPCSTRLRGGCACSRSRSS